LKITILTFGSRGDVQPFLALALGLQRAGQEVKLAAPHRFEAFVDSHGVPFVPLAGDPEVISMRLNDAGRNPVRMVRAMAGYIFSIADQVAREAFAACDDADLIVHSFAFTVGGHSLARRRGIPDISIQTFPIFAPTRHIPPIALPGVRPGPLRYFTHWLFTQVFWHGGNLGYWRLRRADPKTFDLKLRWPFSPVGERGLTPLLLACSPVVVPRPDDWSAPHIHIPGYLYLDASPSYRPSQALREFLAGGEPPVCVTFGSMIHREAGRIYRAVMGALKERGARAILLSGWSDLHALADSTNALVLDAAPHDWLFPRCKTLIHHGGAGTTAAGLRAGIPNVVVPFAADQPFWGARVYELGAGPPPLPVGQLTRERLAGALGAADGEAIQQGARDVGAAIRMEDGVGAAVELILAHAAGW
jgi:sterol 3beta-glucosyltransferase